MKINKSIGLTKETRRVLTIEALDLDIGLKLHCENILEERAKSVVSDGEVKEDVGAEESSLRGIKEEVVDDNLDKSGVFKRVSGEKNVYSNGKCFELRIWVKDEGICKYYHSTIEEAVLARDEIKK